MVSVGVAVSASDGFGPPPTCAVTSISSNQPTNGKGDGPTG